MTTPTLSDDAMLLRAVVATPDDDAPRGAYADWLDERGRHEQAEFIRVQCELARLEEFAPSSLRAAARHDGAACCFIGCEMCATQATVKALRERERSLWVAYSREWFVDESMGMSASLGDHVGPAGNLLGIVRRGFVDEVRVPVAALGGPCERCGNESPETRVAEDAWRGKCPICKGTGHVAGIAAQLNRLPLTGVRVVDREPQSEATGEGERFIWFHADFPERGGSRNGLTDPAVLPVELFDKVVKIADRKAGSHWLHQFGRYSDAWFDTRQAAIDALDTAALALIRGLNPEAAPTVPERD